MKIPTLFGTPLSLYAIKVMLLGSGELSKKFIISLQRLGVDIRVFGKPESFERRRMGVALAADGDAETARIKAKQAAAKINPVIL